MIALHARRSAQPIAEFASCFPSAPIILVLTGTDLYRDIDSDLPAQASLGLASRIVVLQEAGLQRLPLEMRGKAHVIYQSASTLKPVAPDTTGRHADVMMIGHLRDEKDPATFMHAAELSIHPQARFIHIGGALDPAWQARALAAQDSIARYAWLGNLPHAKTRQLLKKCRLMVLTSKMEGGANVIVEALTCAVPVLASDIPGNRGMLGEDYAGYFSVGDSVALARLIDRALADRQFDAQLRRQCARRAPLFAPAREKAAVLDLLDNVFSRTQNVRRMQ